MTLLHADGFDHWGTGATALANMVLGIYSSISTAGVGVVNTGSRTGTNSFVINTGTNVSTYAVSSCHYLDSFFHYPVPNSTGVGCGFAMLLNNAPSPTLSYTSYIYNNTHRLPSFIDANNNEMFSVWIDPSNKLNVVFYGTPLYQTALPVVPNGAYFHIEFQCSTQTVSNVITGTLKCRVNGVSVFNPGTTNQVQGTIGTAAQVAQRTVYTGAGGSTILITVNPLIGAIEMGMAFANSNGFNGGTLTPGCIINVDDFYVYNFTGSYNNTWIGDRRCRTLTPTGDTAQADWTKNSGTVGFNRINEIPQDGDTTYISATAAGNKSDFTFTNLAANVSDIAGVVVYAVQKKSDAGLCNVQTGLVIAGTPNLSVDVPITTAYNYYEGILERDTLGAQFTLSEMNAASTYVRVARTI